MASSWPCITRARLAAMRRNVSRAAGLTRLLRRRRGLQGGGLGLPALVLLGLELVGEHLVRRARNDPVDLRALVQDQADPLDGDVVHEPAVAHPVHAVVHRHLGARLGDELRADLGLVALDGVAEVLDLLAAAALLDLADVGALEQIGEELDELVTLGRRAGLPVTGQRALGDLAEVERLVADLADGGPPLLPPALLHELRIEHLQHALDAAAQLIGGRTRPRRTTAHERRCHRRAHEPPAKRRAHRAYLPRKRSGESITLAWPAGAPPAPVSRRS